jgi:hypothetical protein
LLLSHLGFYFEILVDHYETFYLSIFQSANVLGWVFSGLCILQAYHLFHNLSVKMMDCPQDFHDNEADDSVHNGDKSTEMQPLVENTEATLKSKPEALPVSNTSNGQMSWDGFFQDFAYYKPITCFTICQFALYTQPFSEESLDFTAL